MRALAVSLALAACGTSSTRPAPPPDPDLVANQVTGAAGPSETGEGSDADLWVAQGEQLRKWGDSVGSTKALVLFRQACEQGHPRGCEMVAETLIDGGFYGVAENHSGAALAYDRACRLDQAHACYRYGYYVLEGLIYVLVEDGQLRKVTYGDDDYVARELVHRGCTLGDADACKLIENDPRVQ